MLVYIIEYHVSVVINIHKFIEPSILIRHFVTLNPLDCFPSTLCHGAVETSSNQQSYSGHKESCKNNINKIKAFIPLKG